MTKIKAIIFDLDNTLIDFWTFKRECVKSAVDAMIKAGLKIKQEPALKAVYDIYNEKGMEYNEVFQQFMKRVTGKINYRLLAHALTAYRKRRICLLEPYKGVRQTLTKLKKKGYKLAVVSDAPRLKAWLRIVAMGIDDLLDVVVAFEDTKKRKPHKLPFVAILKKLKIKPHEAIMVGDSISRDIKGAKAIGMKTVLAVYGRSTIPKQKVDEIDFRIKRVSDLLKVVDEIGRD